jgi:hypothetical protein
MRQGILGLSVFWLTVPAAWGDWQAALHAERIEPALPISMAGSMSDQVARRIHDPIHVRAMVLRDGQTTLALVLCDSCMIERPILDEAKQRIEEETGIPPDHVIIAATHSHTCPTSAKVFQSVPNEEYQEQLIERIVTSVATGVLRLEPARVGFGVGQCAEEVFNRRWRMKPSGDLTNPFGGTDQVRMNPPLGSPDLIEPAGPIDPAVSVFWVKAADGEPMGAMANYALHYVGGVPGGEISADYFGEFSRLMGERWKPPAARRKPIVFLTNGASGDINNINFRGNEASPEPFGQIRRVAGRVAERALGAIEGSSVMLEPKLGSIRRELSLGVRKPTPAELSKAESIWKEAEDRPLRTLPEIYAAETRAMSRYPDEVKLWVQAARVGSVGIVAIPCEVFVEVGLEIKKKSPFAQTVIIELANGYNGYLPTLQQHEWGGYETWRAKSSYLEKEASTKIVGTAIELLESLSKDQP